MNYEERRPADFLSSSVKCFWQLRRTYRAGEVGEVLWPDGCQELIFHYGAAYSVSGRTLPRAFFIGSLSRYHHLYADGELRLFGVRLLPRGLAALSDKPVGGFNDSFVPLEEALASKASGLLPDLERRLADTTDMSIAQKLIEAFLSNLLRPSGIDPAMLAVLGKLYGEPASYDVSRAVADSGYSQRQFERLCARLTGLSPKRLHKIARFNRTRLRLMFQPDLDLHDCMLEMGYYDYAHFSKDFKLCLGITPVEYIKWVRRKDGKSRGPQDVVFLQDEL